MRSCAASTRSISIAISRRARLRQGGSESAAPGADFEHRALGNIAQGFHNAHGGRGINQKVLAQFGPAGTLFHGRDFCHP